MPDICFRGLPFEPNGAMWGALLAAARRGEAKLGELCFEVEPHFKLLLFLLSNIYAAHENLDDSAKLRKMMGYRGEMKKSRPSCIMKVHTDLKKPRKAINFFQKLKKRTIN